MPSDSKRGGVVVGLVRALRRAFCAVAWLPLVAWAAPSTPTPTSAPPCHKPLYLTFDTGHMGVAPLIAEVLQRHQVKVTFFAAHEPTQEGDGSLGSHWAAWWRARAAEGHAFASHTFDHVYWQADAADGRFDVRPSAGPNKGQRQRWTAQDYCADITRARERLQALTGVAALPHPGARHRQPCCEPPKLAGMTTWGGRPADFWVTSCPATAIPMHSCCDNRLSASAAVTF
jgi:peptidoglycan-N-acetylmuramic acid deacetylase